MIPIYLLLLLLLVIVVCLSGCLSASHPCCYQLRVGGGGRRMKSAATSSSNNATVNREENHHQPGRRRMMRQDTLSGTCWIMESCQRHLTQSSSPLRLISSGIFWFQGNSRNIIVNHPSAVGSHEPTHRNVKRERSDYTFNHRQLWWGSLVELKRKKPWIWKSKN